MQTLTLNPLAVPPQARPGQLPCPARDDSGASLIELALILPVVFLLTFGLINFTLVIFGLGNVGYAGRAALRYACVHSSTSLTPTTAAAITNIVKPFIFSYPVNTNSTTLSYGASGNVVGDTVTVSVTVTYTIFLPGYTYHGPTFAAASTGIITQ